MPTRPSNIINDWPPNITLIRQYLNPPPYAVFAYGDKIYSPSTPDLPEDIILHEEVHMRQQSLFATPDMWYARYLTDPEFRLHQEIEAYGTQYLWLKERIRCKDAKEALFEMADALSTHYNLPISFQKAESRIRNMV